MPRHTITVRYTHGARVRWARDGGTYTVVQTRVTWRDVLAPVVEYLLQEEPQDPTRIWAYEEDVETGEAPETCA